MCALAMTSSGFHTGGKSGSSAAFATSELPTGREVRTRLDGDGGHGLNRRNSVLEQCACSAMPESRRRAVERAFHIGAVCIKPQARRTGLPTAVLDFDYPASKRRPSSSPEITLAALDGLLARGSSTASAVRRGFVDLIDGPPSTAARRRRSGPSAAVPNFDFPYSKRRRYTPHFGPAPLTNDGFFRYSISKDSEDAAVAAFECGKAMEEEVRMDDANDRVESIAVRRRRDTARTAILPRSPFAPIPGSRRAPVPLPPFL